MVYDQEYYIKNKRRIQLSQNKWRRSDKGRASINKYRENNRPHIRKIMRNGNLLRRRGITIVDYEKRLEDQGGVCAICGTSDSGRVGVFFVDHCHDTGNVRGLLCRRCNSGLGMFQESAVVLKKALCYMQTGDATSLLL